MGLFALFLIPLAGFAQGFRTEVYLTLEQAPRAVFPEADSFERKDISVTPEFSRRIKERVGRAKPTIWEPSYISFVARKAGEIIGYAVVCEEIGKHRPITFIVGATSEGQVKDVAIMMYREPQGVEVRYRGFLRQFEGKDLADPLQQHKDIRNVSGATLSVRALTRGVRKALAVIEAAYIKPDQSP